jgi:transcriptional regulator with XRE-family HTH domain
MDARGVGNRWLADEVDVHVKTVSPWLSGKVVPDDSRISRIAQALEVRVAWLRYGEGASGLEGSVSRETRPRTTLPLPTRAGSRRVMRAIYQYLGLMEEAGVAQEAIDEAERLFTRDNYGQLYSGKRELTEEEQLQVVEASWAFIREVILITQGIRLDAPLRRGPTTYDELPTEPKTPPEVTKPSRGQRKA